MSTQNQVEDLIARIEAAVSSALALAEQCTEEQRQMTVTEEERPVRVVFHHIAYVIPPVMDWAITVAEGKPLPPVTRDWVNKFNAKHFQEYPNPSKEETLSLMRENGATTIDQLRGLTDKQLDITTPFELIGSNDISTQKTIEWFLLNHTQNHLNTIKETLGIK